MEDVERRKEAESTKVSKTSLSAGFSPTPTEDLEEEDESEEEKKNA